MELPREALDRARRARDARFDGRFFIAVTTTRIYCRPICPAPSPKDAHVRYFSTAVEAEEAGFRPCLRCRPEAAPGTPAWHGTRGLVSRAVRLIAEGALDEGRVDQLAERLGITARHLRRLLVQHLGATPLRVARGRYECRLPYRAPYDWDAALAFLRARATPGVEQVSASTYRRTISVGGAAATIEVSNAAARSMLTLSARLVDPRALLDVVDRTRRIFDTSANPTVIAGDLEGDPLLRDLSRRHPGLRVIGAWDGFEIAVRAILGQQISVRAATTLAGRLAAAFGSPYKVQGFRGSEVQKFGSEVERFDAQWRPDLNRLFPTPAQLVGAPIEQAGVMPARAETIRQLARRVADGAIVFDARTSAVANVAALRAVPGIGEWTAQYIAMRALTVPDAFLSTDLILRRVAGNLTARDLERRAEAWRPWRAYAVMLLWQGGNDDVENVERRGGRAAADRGVVALGAE
jgi:AraC family transcriptional regulator, regulatory protein of adaptative response / DNA-3-methyladenine glycosylase II